MAGGGFGVLEKVEIFGVFFKHPRDKSRAVLFGRSFD